MKKLSSPWKRTGNTSMRALRRMPTAPPSICLFSRIWLICTTTISARARTITPRRLIIVVGTTHYPRVHLARTLNVCSATNLSVVWMLTTHASSSRTRGTRARRRTITTRNASNRPSERERISTVSRVARRDSKLRVIEQKPKGDECRDTNERFNSNSIPDYSCISRCTHIYYRAYLFRARAWTMTTEKSKKYSHPTPSDLMYRSL